MARLPGVAYVEDNLFSCAVDSTTRMRETIQTHRLNRVVVAACSPRTHEGVFREVLAAAGLNPGYFAFAKSGSNAPGSIRRSRTRPDQGPGPGRHGGLPGRGPVPIQPQSFPVIPRALVLGGGVAGLTPP